MTTSSDPIRITFLGPTGVGKTSVLAAISEIMEKQIQEAKVKLTFGATTWPRMKDAIDDLRERCFRPNMASTRNVTKVVYDLEVAPTVLNGWISGVVVPIEIIDYPGEWLMGIPDRVKQVKETIGQASVVMIAIDAVGLMNSKDPDYYFVNSSNQVEQVTNILRESIADVESKERKLVMFVPIRSEPWMHTAEQQRSLTDRLKEVYADAIQMFAQPKLANRIALVIAPVCTLGIIEFLRYGPIRPKPILDTDQEGRDIIPSGPISPKNYEAYFHRVKPTKSPEPAYADQLLKYAMAFTMVLLLERTKEEIRQETEQFKKELQNELVSSEDPAWIKWLAGGLANITGDALGMIATTVVNWPTNQALSNFAQGRRETLPFQILQGSHLLRKPK